MSFRQPVPHLRFPIDALQALTIPCLSPTSCQPVRRPTVRSLRPRMRFNISSIPTKASLHRNEASGRSTVQGIGTSSLRAVTQTNPRPEEPLQVSVGPDFRALLHLSVRTQPSALTPDWADALLALVPSEVYQHCRLAEAFPSVAFDDSENRTQNPRTSYRRRNTGCQSDIAWSQLRRPGSTPMGFVTSYDRFWTPSDCSQRTRSNPHGLTRASTSLPGGIPECHEL